MREAEFYEVMEERKIHCRLCPHDCLISNGKRGICQVRENREGKLFAESYGKITSMALDSIEKKPLYHFYPGKKILSIGSYNCNFRCGFCQNHEISMGTPEYKKITPEELAALSLELEGKDNIGVAYTYNEPFISGEFLKDCANLIHVQGQKNVVVTNGFVQEEPLRELLPYIDAMNIDLKSFQPSFYKNIGGEIEEVKRTIKFGAESCHVEVATLIIPGENDTPAEMERLAGWLSKIDQKIPLHISRFFPVYEYWNRTATPVEKIYQLVEIAKGYLDYVYPGNC